MIGIRAGSRCHKDRQGRYVRGFGEHGVSRDHRKGQLNETAWLCFTADDDLVAVDSLNYCVQVLREEGTCSFKFGSNRLSEGDLGDAIEIFGPLDVCFGPKEARATKRDTLRAERCCD